MQGLSSSLPARLTGPRVRMGEDSKSVSVPVALPWRKQKTDPVCSESAGI